MAGAGSIGRRHLENLCHLNAGPLAVCDPDSRRLASTAKNSRVRAFADFEEALAAHQPGAVLICTPPSLHVPQALAAAQAGAHVFIEKPLSHSLGGISCVIKEVEARGLIAQVGYNLRFHPGLVEVKRLLDSNAIGKVLWARAEFGQYLPDWRPWQDYRQSYTARRELGGGILLDASHELDYLAWLLGPPRELVCMAGKVSQLEVDVEDSATVLLRFDGRVQADVHVDFFQREYSRSCKFAGADGTLELDFGRNRLELRRPGRAAEVMALPVAAAELAYRTELECFLNCAATGQPPPVGLREGERSLKLALAALESANTRRWIACD